VQVEIRNVFKQPDDVTPYIVFDPSFDAHRDFAGEDQADASSAFERYEQEALIATEAFTMAFEAGLRAKRERRPVFGADEGFIDPVILPEYATGSVQPDRMYLQYAAEDDVRGVAASILVDCSGSMGNGPSSKSYLARLAAIACHQALRSVQVPHEVCGFTTLHESEMEHHYFAQGSEVARDFRAQFRNLRSALIEAEKHGTDIYKFARVARGGRNAHTASLVVPVHATFKRFDQEDGRGLCHITGNSENLDGEAVIWQARRLARRPERRRVLIVMSDGFPAGSRDNAQGARYLKEVVERVIRAGIEVYGIGIKSAAVKQFYPLWWHVNDVEDLARVAVESLTDVIVRNRSEQECVAPL
jgi:cobaltochelatase CobT